MLFFRIKQIRSNKYSINNQTRVVCGNLILIKRSIGIGFVLDVQFLITLHHIIYTKQELLIRTCTVRNVFHRVFALVTSESCNTQYSIRFASPLFPIEGQIFDTTLYIFFTSKNTATALSTNLCGLLAKVRWAILLFFSQ